MNIRAEIVTRISDDVWVRSLLNGGCGLIKDNREPAYDNRVKTELRAAEGFISLSLTENRYEDRTSKFVDASVNFRQQETNLLIRVDNQIPDKSFHFNVEDNGKIVEDHTRIENKSREPPLNFALKEVLEYLQAKYANIKKPWKIFGVPPISMLGDLLRFNGRRFDDASMFPIALVGFPGSEINMKVFSRKAISLRDLVPVGFVLQKNPWRLRAVLT